MENHKKIFLISGILVVALVAGLGFVLWQKFAKNTESKGVPPGAAVDSSQPIDSSATQIVTSTVPSPVLDSFRQQVDAVAVTDQDLDGLTDSEEVQYKTNPISSDTDNDGLLDKDEVTIFRTDPLDPDTDKDTYADGVEVRGGFNPNGTGPLITL